MHVGPRNTCHSVALGLYACGFCESKHALQDEPSTTPPDQRPMNGYSPSLRLTELTTLLPLAHPARARGPVALSFL